MEYKQLKFYDFGNCVAMELFINKSKKVGVRAYCTQTGGVYDCRFFPTMEMAESFFERQKKEGLA